jgi:hypothetical protein
MAENKKSFLLYCDMINTFENLEDKEAGRLIKHLFRYVNDKNPEYPDRITKLLFEPIKTHLKRDLLKYESIREKRSIAGLRSAELRQQNQHVLTSVESVQQTSTNPTVNDNVNVIVNDNVIKNNIDERKLKFSSTLKPFLEKYGKEMLNDFYKYWTEPNKSKTKFRQENEKFWDLQKRLETWDKNQKVKTESEPQTKVRKL